MNKEIKQILFLVGISYVILCYIQIHFFDSTITDAMIFFASIFIYMGLVMLFFIGALCLLNGCAETKE